MMNMNLTYLDIIIQVERTVLGDPIHPLILYKPPHHKRMLVGIEIVDRDCVQLVGKGHVVSALWERYLDMRLKLWIRGMDPDFVDL